MSEPRNVVENPILNSPFQEPMRHHDFSGAAPRVVEGARRPAGYIGVPRTERMGDGAQVRHPLIPLPLVNDIRSRVAEWRKRGYPNVTRTTRDLLDHWNRDDNRLFFCQREAVETIIWLVEATPADRQGIDVPTDEPKDLDRARKGYGALRRYCAKMATGSGKTTVMAMVAAWSIINKGVNRKDARFSDAVLVVGPNLTVKERLRVLDPRTGGNYYEKFDLIPNGYRDLLARGRVFVTNWHVFAVKDDGNRRGIVQRGRESDAAFVRRVLGKELGAASQLLVLNDEAHHAYRPSAPPTKEQQELVFAGLSSDERKEAEEFAEEATVWIGGLDRINKVRGIRMVADLSATPYYLRGSGYEEGSPLPWIVSDFGLVDAIESGITKVPRVPVADDSGRPDPKYFHLWREIMQRLPESERQTAKRKAKPEAVWAHAVGAFAMLATKWSATAEHFAASSYPVPPALIIVAANTALAEVAATAIRSGDTVAALKGDSTFAIDSKVLAAAEAAEEGGSRDDAQELLRLKTATVGKARWPDDKPPVGWEDLAEPPGKDVRCVVSVGMLTEGWDAQNVTQILGLRAFSSQLLCEQVVGRGLRRMSYDTDPATGMLTPEYCDVFGIPFEVIPVQGTQPGAAPPQRESTLVEAVEARKLLEITFPRVEGYILDVKQRVRCEVDRVEPLTVEPQIEPTEVIVQQQAGWGVVGKAGFNTGSGAGVKLTREQFYLEHRRQRTEFEIAREITEVLAGGRVSMGPQPAAPRQIDSARLLFPQVLAIVAAYLDRRVRLASAAARIEEVALALYRTPIIERLLAAIEPDTDAGEAALLPRIERHRPVGSTAEVQFRTTKPTKPTWRSHISHVVLDSPVWEGTAAYHLEQSPYVAAYAKNDHLGFEILYEWQDTTHKYIPDFLVCLDGDGRGTTLILEIKGYETEQDRAKWEGAKKWVRAVNHHGGFGRWDHLVCKEPNAFPAKLEKWREAASRAHRLAFDRNGS